MDQLTLGDFQQIMVCMLSNDNERRTSAEAQYDSIAIQQRAELLFKLFQQTSVGDETRSMCLVLLRRLLTEHWNELWTEGQTRDMFCEQLLTLSMAETGSSLIRKRVGDVIAEIARNTVEEESGRQTWTGVLKYIEMCSASENPAIRETAMILIENVPGIFGIDQSRYIFGIKQMLHSNMTYPNEHSVRTAAVRAYVSFLCDNDEDQSVIKTFSDMVPVVLQVCKETVATEADDDVSLQCLTDLATSVPKILRPHFNDLFQLCLGTAADKDKEASFRHSALEVLVSLCESSPAMVRKHASHYILNIVGQCLQLMTEIEEDDDSWYTTDTMDGDDEDDNASVGETSLDRVACAIGGKATLPPALQIVPQLLSNENWKSRHAGIMALSTIGEGCKRLMEPMIEQIVDTVFPFLTDSHPRVCYAACNALGQMSTDFAPTFQKKCHAKVVPALLTLLGRLEEPRVAAHAGAAMVNFSEACPKNIISVYLPDIMLKMELVLEMTYQALLEKGKKLVLEQVITTIASVADASQDQFIAFYDRLMPKLKFILINAKEEQFRLLRGKTIECISLIGLAVGRDKFLADANEMMQMLLESQTELGSAEATNDPHVSYMISAWARICKLLQADFAPYLPLVMPPVIRAAQFKPEVTVMTEEEAADRENENDWNFVSLGDQQSFGIRTAGLEDKATACEMLVCYARELKGAFADYVEPVTQLMLPLLKFYFHDGVRSAAADSLPRLLDCAKVKGGQFLAEMWAHIFPSLLDAIHNEHDLEVLADHLHSMAQCIEVLGEVALNGERMQSLFEMLSAELTKHEDRCKKRNESGNEEEQDEETEIEMGEQVEQENGVIARISDILHAAFMTYRDQLLVPYFENLETQLVKLLSTGRYFGDRQWAICMYDDLIEYGGPNSVKYQESFYGPMLRALSDEYAEVRQAAAYGFGVMAMHGGNAYAQALAGALDGLGRMVEREDARSSNEALTATENAISAVAKILKYNASMVDASKVVPTFLNWLPVSEDKEECPHVYGYFCDLVESNNALALGENNSNLARIFTVVVEAFNRDAFSDDVTDTKQRMANIVKHVQSNQEMFDAVLSAANLNHDQQLALHNILNM